MGRNWNPVAGKSQRTRIVPERGEHVFRSKAEATYYDELRLREVAGEVRSIEIEPRYDLAGVTYRPDFWFEELIATVSGPGGEDFYDWRSRIVEVKSKRISKNSEQMRRFRRNQKQMKHFHGVDVQLVLR